MVRARLRYEILVRMLFSLLVDADLLNTEEWEKRQLFGPRWKRKSVSIIEQNAKDYREIFSKENVLEHYSSVDVLRELKNRYSVSFVFCSATQPAFKRTTNLKNGFGDDEITEIAHTPQLPAKALPFLPLHDKPSHLLLNVISDFAKGATAIAYRW
jgi:hypothetical protein